MFRTRSLRMAFVALLICLLPFVPASAGADGPTCFGKTATSNDHSGTIEGTDGADVLIGDVEGNLILGYGGGDRICSKGGRDRVTGGGGPDLIDGGGGPDSPEDKKPTATTPMGGEDKIPGLFGGGGDDGINGGAGADLIEGGAQDDTLRGEEGHDSIQGGNGSDEAFGNEGSDGLYLVDGVEGNDSGFGGPNPEEMVDYCTQDSGDELMGCEAVAVP